MIRLEILSVYPQPVPLNNKFNIQKLAAEQRIIEYHHKWWSSSLQLSVAVWKPQFKWSICTL